MSCTRKISKLLLNSELNSTFAPIVNAKYPTLAEVRAETEDRDERSSLKNLVSIVLHAQNHASFFMVCNKVCKQIKNDITETPELNNEITRATDNLNNPWRPGTFLF